MYLYTVHTIFNAVVTLSCPKCLVYIAILLCLTIPYDLEDFHVSIPDYLL